MALDDFFRFTGKGINGKSWGKAVRGGLGYLPAVIILKAIQASLQKDGLGHIMVFHYFPGGVCSKSVITPASGKEAGLKAAVPDNQAISQGIAAAIALVAGQVPHQVQVGINFLHYSSSNLFREALTLIIVKAVHFSKSFRKK